MENNKRIDETWVPTTCTGCFPQCAILVHRKDGKVIGLRGDPAVHSSLGKCCGKGMARVSDLYHPNRVTKPLKRTNPKKGIGVDPKWEEISWEEAMDIVVERLDKLRRDDPRKLVIGSMDFNHFLWQYGFGKAFGTPNTNWYNGAFCGGGLHWLNMLVLAADNAEVDLERCNYIVLWGSQFGLGANNNPGIGTRNIAKAKKRGAKLVVVDPICSHAAAKADEWIPIIPGTDGALGLGISNLLVNELGIYDTECLKRRTNAPYLVGEDGHYVRDEHSQKPLVWDQVEGVPKVYDDENVKDYGLEDSYEVGVKKCRPVFQLLREQLKKYTVEDVSRITGVPQATIRRFAKEFSEAAQIGATIEIKGHTFPYRPAATETKRGATQHKNGFWNCLGVMLPNILVGSVNVPGGLLGVGSSAPFGLWKPKGLSECKDGLVTMDQAFAEALEIAEFSQPYPSGKVSPPESLNLRELMPCSRFRSGLAAYTMHDPERFHIPYRPEVLIVFRFNPLMSMMDPRKIAETLKKMDFIISFVSKTIDETSEFADLIIPEADDFERYWPFPANIWVGFIPPGPGHWYGQILQPVVDPPSGVRNWADFMTDVAERLGILPEMNRRLNLGLGLSGLEKYELRPDKKYTVEDISKRTASVVAGKEYQKDWFLKTSSMDFYEKTIEESFPLYFSKARVPIYFEYFIDAGKQVEKVTRELGMDWWDTSYYHPLPEWHPCPAHEMDDSEYDLIIANAKLPLHFHTLHSENPWIDDICKRNPLDYNILLHPSAAKKKGIKDGDLVWVESETNRVKGKVRVTECVHPKVVGTFAILGHWARDKIISRGKGININSLVKFGWDMVDTVSGQMDFCAKVKVYKA